MQIKCSFCTRELYGGHDKGCPYHQVTRSTNMASCVLFKKSTISRPLPGKPDPAANPGEFGLLDNEDGTLTLVIVDPSGCPSPIDTAAATIKVESDNPSIVEISGLSGFTWTESLAKGTSGVTGKGAPAKAPGSHATYPPVKHTASGPGAGGVANITAVVTWAGESASTYTLTWKDTVVGDPKGGLRLERSDVSLTNG